VESREAVAEEDAPKVILGVGAATAWDTRGGAAIFAPHLFAEMTPREDLLALEAGVTPFYPGTLTEWDVNFLVKKPWTLSRGAEFTLGVGPVWVYRKEDRRVSNAVAGEVAGEFLFWPGRSHHFGWYLEPAYDHSFMAGHAQSLGMSAGLLIGLGRRAGQ